MKTFYYLAYGSNLHPERLKERTPSAKFLKTVQLTYKKLSFHKKSTDGSGKCTFHETNDPTDILWCALYEIDREEKHLLDKAEGLHYGYDEVEIEFKLYDKTIQADIYFATDVDANQIPYHWYKDLVLFGARFHKLPKDYISSIELVRSKTDENSSRALKNEEILKRMELLPHT